MTGKSAGSAGAEVVEIERLARGHIGIAWSTKASLVSVCTASGSRNTIQTSDDHWRRLLMTRLLLKRLRFGRLQIRMDARAPMP